MRQRPFSDDMHEIASLAEDYGFHRVRAGCGYAHGVRNLIGTEGSLFCYHGLERSSRTEEILGLIIPHFHEALRRAGSPPTNGSSLTGKEAEVLKWLKEGKSNWDISTILGISERTVKFHVGNIMRKLDAVTRTHAVAKAIGQGVLDIELTKSYRLSPIILQCPPAGVFSRYKRLLFSRKDAQNSQKRVYRLCHPS